MIFLSAAEAVKAAATAQERKVIIFINLCCVWAHPDSTTNAGIGARPLGCRNVRYTGGVGPVPLPSRVRRFCSLKAALLYLVVMSRCACACAARNPLACGSY